MIAPLWDIGVYWNRLHYAPSSVNTTFFEPNTLKIIFFTFVLPSLLVYIFIKPLKGESYFSKCTDEKFVMIIVYPLGFAYILIQCLSKLNLRRQHNKRKSSPSAKIIKFLNKNKP
jgi:hypothetical protein